MAPTVFTSPLSPQTLLSPVTVGVVGKKSKGDQPYIVITIKDATITSYAS